MSVLSYAFLIPYLETAIGLRYDTHVLRLSFAVHVTQPEGTSCHASITAPCNPWGPHAAASSHILIRHAFWCDAVCLERTIVLYGLSQDIRWCLSQGLASM